MFWSVRNVLRAVTTKRILMTDIYSASWRWLILRVRDLIYKNKQLPAHFSLLTLPVSPCPPDRLAMPAVPARVTGANTGRRERCRAPSLPLSPPHSHNKPSVEFHPSDRQQYSSSVREQQHVSNQRRRKLNRFTVTFYFRFYNEGKYFTS